MAIFDLCAQINDSIKLDYQTPAPPGLHILYKLSTELLSQTTTLIIKKICKSTIINNMQYLLTNTGAVIYACRSFLFQRFSCNNTKQWSEYLQLARSHQPISCCKEDSVCLAGTRRNNMSHFKTRHKIMSQHSTNPRYSKAL